MALLLSNYAEAKGCAASVVIRAAIHQLLLNEGIDCFDHSDHPPP